MLTGNICQAHVSNLLGTLIPLRQLGDDPDRSDDERGKEEPLIVVTGGRNQ